MGAKIRAVFFDLDNTLYDFNRWNRIGQQRADAYGVEKLGPAKGQLIGLYKRSMEEYPLRLGINNPAIHSRVLRFKDVLEKCDIPVESHALELTKLYWSAFLENMKPEPGISELLDALKKNGIITGVGTNMTALIQFMKLDVLGLSEKIDHLITSEEAGYEKPDPRFFEYCLSKAGVTPEECVFIGDDLERDIPAPKDLGMRAIWYTGIVVNQNEESAPGTVSFDISQVPDGVGVIRDYQECLKEDQIQLGNIILN